MKLSPQEKKLIAYLFFHGSETASEAARVLKTSESQIRRAIDKLKEQRVIYRVPFVNPSVIGLTTYQLFVTVLSLGRSAQEKMLRFFSNHDQVVWLGALGAEYQLDIMLLGASVSDVASFLNDVGDSLPGVDLQFTAAAEVSFTYYPPRYLHPEDFGKPFLRIDTSPTPTPLQEQEHAILRAMIDFPELSRNEIAKKLRMPASTFHHRVQQLERKGVIECFGYMVRPYSVGMSPLLYLIHAKRRSTALFEKLHKFALANPAVTFLIEQVGDWDYQLGARFADAHEGVKFLEDLHDAVGDSISRIRPIPVLESVKFEAYPRKKL